MKIKVTKTYEVNDVERRAIARSISSKNELASHKECQDYLESFGDADLDDLVKSYYADMAQYYTGLAKGGPKSD